MKIRPWAEFTAELPDDHIEDEDGIVQFGGKSVADALRQMLERLGCAVEPLQYADEHGWEFSFGYRGRRLWCQVTLIEGYTAVFEDTSLISRLMKRHHPAYVEILTSLSRALKGDERFHDVRWYERDQVLSGLRGAETPIEE